ncbi:MAG: NAD-dependent epimerase/dehydratase family protein [Casimicrobiaceae bacterium]
MPILVTGAAGFIGRSVCVQLCSRGERVLGIDTVSDYGDPALKLARVRSVQAEFGDGFIFSKLDLVTAADLAGLLRQHDVRVVIHLAAQPGVRHSIEHPEACIQNNLVAFGNLLEACRHAQVEHLLYASSSSVYGANRVTPFSEQHVVDHPVSLYAATKKANELMAHSYSHIHGLPTTGLRFFTVYGPWGRPDMAPWLFTEAMLAGKPIRIFNHGQSLRDFTYIDDVARAVVALVDKPPARDPTFDQAHPRPDRSDAPYRILNIGNEQPVPLLEFVETLERTLGVTAIKHFEPAQPGDMVATAADVSALRALIGFAPATPLEVGLRHWVDWYRDYLGLTRAPMQ